MKKEFLMRKPLILPAVLLMLTAITGAYSNSGEPETHYYYNLQFLKDSRGPRPVQVLDPSGRHASGSHGVLFTYKNRDAKSVAIAGNFSNWKPVAMQRSRHAVWYYYHESEEAREFHYKYIVDGIWIYDPETIVRKDDGIGSYFSMTSSPQIQDLRRLTYRELDDGRIEFRIYKPEAKTIALVGDFNHWNPEHDLMRRDARGVWTVTKRLGSGSWRYQFVIDGEWLPDIYNEKNASDRAGRLCSMIVVE